MFQVQPSHVKPTIPCSFTQVLKIAVASTKAYTAQIAALAFLAKQSEANGNAKAQAFDLVHELSIVAQSIESTLSEKETIEAKVRELLETTRNAFYIGRGQDYYVAMEASLKLKEISYIQCEGFAAGELKHGTIALIEEGTPVLALLSDQFLPTILVEISKRSQPVVPKSSLSQKRM